jgi:hypothetical protein
MITRDLWTFCALFVKLDAMEETSFWISLDVPFVMCIKDNT